MQAAVLDRTRLHCSVGIGDTLVGPRSPPVFGKRPASSGSRRKTGSRSWGLVPPRNCGAWGPRSPPGWPNWASHRLRARRLETYGPGPEFGPRMGPWYAELGRGDGASVVDGHPVGGARHSRGDNLPAGPDRTGPAGRRHQGAGGAGPGGRSSRRTAVFGLTLKVRYAPFTTTTHERKIPQTLDRNEILARTWTSPPESKRAGPFRLLGLRAEMAMPDEAERAIPRRAAAGDLAIPFRRGSQSASSFSLAKNERANFHCPGVVPHVVGAPSGLRPATGR